MKTVGLALLGMLIAILISVVVPDLVWLHQQHRATQLQQAAAQLINAERAKQPPSPEKP